MSDKEIIVCTTLRDFNGSENDLIQLEFLKSLKLQERIKIKLIITLFGEKNVPKIVKGFFDDVFFYDGIPGDFRYSLTQVMNNAIDYNAKHHNSELSIFWTTCDVIYEKDFVLKCIPYLQEKSIVTSHPHKIVDLKSFQTRSSISGLNSGFDMLIFSNSLVSDQKFVDTHKDYVFKDWGVYEHFLISLNELIVESQLFNIFEDSKIMKIENDRVLTNESNQFLSDSHKRNNIIFNEFLKKHSLTNNYLNLTYCHLQFSVTRNRIMHYSRFMIDILNYYILSKLNVLSKKYARNLIKFIFKRLK